MAAIANAAVRDLPGSPPDLSDSKSSKSSSFRSSSLADTSSCDLGHFEDISLDDIGRKSSEDGENLPRSATWTSCNLISRPKPSPAFYPFGGAQTLSSRDLTSGKPFGLIVSARSNITNGPRTRYQLPVPGPRSSRQQPQSRSPSLLHPGLPSFRSRSPSPSTPTGASLRTNTSSAFSNTVPSTVIKRRQSWQPGRKTVKELEDEYHDSDEEIPDDAIVWNVPMSPRDAHQRDFRRTQTDPTPLNTSPSSLPHIPHLQNAFDVHLRNNYSRRQTIINTSTINTAQFNNSSPEIDDSSNVKSFSSSPVPASPVSDASSAEFPEPSNNTREAALSDLSKEARELSEALELYAEESEKALEVKIQSGKFKHGKAFSTDMCFQLAKNFPPMRKNDPLIDPLPASKEKERFLTRTRPSWLPPKNPKEEKKHLKEYKKMMEQAVEAERKRARKLGKLQTERDAAAAARKNQWEQHVLPNWDQAVKESQTQELWWHGIPGHRRGEVWAKAVGNELGLSQTSFDAALSRAREVESRLTGLNSDEIEMDQIGAIFARFKTVADGLYPELHLFQRGLALHQPFLDVTMAYAMYRVDAGCDVDISVSK
jgi:hypothetical protein